MRRAGAVALLLAAVMLAGCGGGRPFVLSGDDKSVQVGYVGEIAATEPLARQYCARYGRTAHLAEAGGAVAYFDCIGR